jgi:hypothetical protein
MSDNVLLTALAFARNGHGVFPLWWPVTHDGRTVCACGRLCGKSAAKHPVARYAPDGVYSASIEPGVIKLWFSLRVPEANLGVHCDGLVVVDIDPDDGGDESLQKLEHEHGELPLTWRSLTGGGGQHILFTYRGGVRVPNIVAKLMDEPPLGPGIDIRSKGGYIVAPPSRHISGRSYAWSVDHHPKDVPLAPAPDWLITRLTTARGAATDPDGASIEPLPSDFWWRLTHEPIEQYRNMRAAQIAGHFFRHACDYQLVLGMLHAWNTAWCKPPLGYLELKQIVDRIANKQADAWEREQ